MSTENIDKIDIEANNLCLNNASSSSSSSSNSKIKIPIPDRFKRWINVPFINALVLDLVLLSTSTACIYSLLSNKGISENISVALLSFIIGTLSKSIGVR